MILHDPLDIMSRALRGLGVDAHAAAPGTVHYRRGAVDVVSVTSTPTRRGARTHVTLHPPRGTMVWWRSGRMPAVTVLPAEADRATVTELRSAAAQILLLGAEWIHAGGEVHLADTGLERGIAVSRITARVGGQLLTLRSPQSGRFHGGWCRDPDAADARLTLRAAQGGPPEHPPLEPHMRAWGSAVAALEHLRDGPE